MTLEPPTLAAIQHIVSNLRDRDRLEIDMAALDPFDPNRIAGQLFGVWWYRGLIGQVVRVNGEPAALLVLARSAPHSIDASFVATPAWASVAARFTRHCVANLRPMVLAAGIRRIECRAWEGHSDARRWLAWFGAKEECRIPGWGRDGETFIQYAWSRDNVHEIAKGEAATGCSD